MTIKDQTLDRLRELLSKHGEVRNLSTFAGDQKGVGMVLATMKSSADAIAIGNHHKFQLFGYDSLIIGEEWIKHNLPSE